MKVLALDDERPALCRLTAALAQVLPEAETRDFLRAREALASVQNGFTPDVAFLDIETPGMSGMELARAVKSLAPCAKIVFITGYDQYALEAYSIHADGYLMKPVTAEKLSEQMEYLKSRTPVEASRKRVRVKCLGNFEAYLDDEPMKFAYSKTKELLAYLIDRNGALCPVDELVTILWEDASGGEKNAYFKRVRADLLSAFAETGCENHIVRRRGLLGVSVGEFEWDYYDWLAKKPDGDKGFLGEYMTQYSWGERTLGRMASNAEPLT